MCLDGESHFVVLCLLVSIWDGRLSVSVVNGGKDRAAAWGGNGNVRKGDGVDLAWMWCSCDCGDGVFGIGCGMESEVVVFFVSVWVVCGKVVCVSLRCGWGLARIWQGGGRLVEKNWIGCVCANPMCVMSVGCLFQCSGGVP